LRRAIFAATLIVASGLPDSTLAQDTRTLQASDSVAILHAAWRRASDGHRERRALWFWVPSTPDTSDVAPLSFAIRAALVRLQIAAFHLRPAGDDTVVFHLTQWQADSAGVLLEFRSAWTTIRGVGDRRCRTGVGNVERFRVSWEDNQWKAERAGPVLHGDSMCRPIAPEGRGVPPA
jgi:hypothetical protein